MRTKYIVEFLESFMTDKEFTNKKELIKYIKKYKSMPFYNKDEINFIVWKEFKGKKQKAWTV